MSQPVPTPGARLPGGLLYTSADAPGFRREKHGDGFRYRRPDGSWLTDEAEIARIRKLAIPPAYTDVWICAKPNGHLQAIGIDARGRKQYRYHADWRSLRDADKFGRLAAFGRALPKLRARVARDMAGGSRPTRERVLATLVRLLDTTFIRVGNAEYARDNDSYGLTTLRNPHAGVRGSTVKLKFRGKSGKDHAITLDDPGVAAVVRRCQQLPGQELFQYEDADGQPHSLGSADVNAYLAAITDGGFTAKDFRTWHGTVQALELTRAYIGARTETPSAERYSAKAVLEAVSRQLGNTPAVCKKAYIHPEVLALGARIAGEAEAVGALWERIVARPRRGRGLSAAEHRLLGFLDLLARERAARPAGRRHRAGPTPQRVASRRSRERS